MRGNTDRRHPFEPWRLVFGLALLVLVAVHVVRLTEGDGAGEPGIPLIAVFVMVPLALLVSGAVAAVTFAARRMARGARVRWGGRTDAATGDPDGG
ncbi:hypothetical protein [Streptomyces sp. RFCAC02]|uniref:hypothetical protein n=1 Tax=Streptomyces sp. RFCAC02 TaxID=2499143 RepID=UPI0010205F9D|nr:hypothetical protein [Streptomyces sp. RFCAC02]